MPIAATIGGFFCAYMLCMPYQSLHTLESHIEAYTPASTKKRAKTGGSSQNV